MFLLVRIINNKLNDYLNNGKNIIQFIQIKYNELIRQQKEHIKFYSLINKINHTNLNDDGIYVYKFYKVNFLLMF